MANEEGRVCESTNILLVVQPLVEKHVDHAKCERGIRTRPYLNPAVGESGCLAQPWVDRHESRAVLFPGLEEVLHVALVRHGRVVSPRQEVPTVHPLVPELRPPASENRSVTRGHRSTTELGNNRGRAAKAVPEGRIDPPARAERSPVSCSVEGQKGLVAVLVSDLAITLGDRVERFIPTDPLPLVLAALAHPAHGVFEPMWAIELADA